MAKSKSLSRHIADLDRPTFRDFDPEEERQVQDSEDDSGSEGSGDELEGTDHYVDVGKSKLRKPAEVPLGPKYKGSRISREALLQGYDEDPESGSDDIDDVERADHRPNFEPPEDVEVDIDEDDDEIDSDTAFGESDEEKYRNYSFRGSSGKVKRPGITNGIRKRPTAADFLSDSEDEESDINSHGSDDEIAGNTQDVDGEHGFESETNFQEFKDEEEEGQKLDEDSNNEESMSDEGEESEEDSLDASENGDDEQAKRAELRKIMNEEQKSLVATISQAAKADVNKGNAVKQQRKTFGSLLNVRMLFQKALVATNSTASIDEKDTEEEDKLYQAAEEAAIRLWNTLDGLRQELSKASKPSKTGQKRKPEIDISTPSSEIWERMQELESSNIDTRNTTLEKWSAKVKASKAQPVLRKLNASTQQTITSVLQEQLANSDHLIKRTKIPRSCAPVQASLKVTEDPNIYDDADWYQMLLQELIAQKKGNSFDFPALGQESGKPMWTIVKEAKTKKNVDTKASKGRKLRYTVHEKLQNFMAPEDRRSWEQDAIDRFFGTLLGRKMVLEEDEEAEEEEKIKPEAGLRLFRS